MTTLAERIEARMLALGKNPSSVALEAGMGRSSVRDIIAKAANPRIDTLRKLTGPLQCSLEYLTGDSEDPGEQPIQQRNFGLLSRQNLLSKQRTYDAPLVETGAFRPVGTLAPARRVTIDPLMLNQMDYTGYGYGWVVVADSSLEEIQIKEGDMLSYAAKAKEPTPVRVGDHLVTSLRLGKSAHLAEHAVRTVVVEAGQIVLRSHGAIDQFQDVRLSEDPTQIDAWERRHTARGDFNLFATDDGNSILLHGIIVRVMRLFKPPV